MMRDDRRAFVPQEDPKVSAGFGTFAAYLFGGVMTLALIDRGLTIAWQSMSSTWASLVTLLGIG